MELKKINCDFLKYSFSLYFKPADQFYKIANSFLVCDYLWHFMPNLKENEWIRSSKIGARERSVTKLFFISEAYLPLKLI